MSLDILKIVLVHLVKRCVDFVKELIYFFFSVAHIGDKTDENNIEQHVTLYRSTTCNLFHSALGIFVTELFRDLLLLCDDFNNVIMYLLSVKLSIDVLLKDNHITVSCDKHIVNLGHILLDCILNNYFFFFLNIF